MNRCVWIILNKNFEMMLDGEISENKKEFKKNTMNLETTFLHYFWNLRLMKYLSMPKLVKNQNMTTALFQHH